MSESDAGQCREIILVRDAYRRCGGKRHFKMHYNRQQCSRKAGPNGYCWQHPWGLSPSERLSLPPVHTS